MHRAIMHQDGHQITRINTQKPFTPVTTGNLLDIVRFPGNALQVEKDPGLLGTVGQDHVQQVHPLPVQNRPCSNINVE